MELPNYIKNRYWKDFLPPGISLEIDIPDNVSLRDVYENGAKEYSDKISMVYALKRSFTFKELHDLTNRFANALIKLGIKKGDIVAIWLPNSPHFTIAYFATLSIGAVVTAISPLFVAREMKYQVIDSNAKILIMIDRFFRQYKKVKDELPVEKVILTNIEGKAPKKAEEGKIIHWNTLMDQNLDPKPLPDIKINPKEDVACLQYTGGTTGLPKGAILTHYNIYANMMQIKEISDYMKNEYIKGDLVAISVLPWYHIYGQTCELAVGPITGSKGLVFPTFDVKTILEAIQTEKPNTMLGVTTMFLNLLYFPDSKDVDFTCLKYANVGAGALPEELAREWKEKTGFAIGEGYGLSEASPVVTNSPPWAKKKKYSCGHPIANTLVGIVDEHNKFLDVGDIGELVVAGPQVFKGYHNRPQETENVFFETEGLKPGETLKWLKTGDFARLDEEGYIYLVDRVKDLIKYKGHSVYPREVEEILYEHPAILECTVIGVPDPEKGENIKA
ncbi:MAG: AMP-binding protein, partial [Candidatus Helarchaeota archaeon]